MERCSVIRIEKRGRECARRGETNQFCWGVAAKARSPQRFCVRGRVVTGVESPRHDPKPVDPGLVRVKRGESLVEARKRCCDTSARVNWAKG